VHDGLTERPELLVLLEVAVPLWRERWRGRPPDLIVRRASALSSVVGSQGDAILYKTKKLGRSAEAFNALAEGVALLSMAPGGCDLFGRHWHDGCPASIGAQCPARQ